MAWIATAAKDSVIVFENEPFRRKRKKRRIRRNGHCISRCSEVKEPMSGDLHKGKAGLGAKGKMKGEISVSSVPGGLSSQKM